MLQPTFIAEINGKTHVKFNRQLFELNPEAFTVTTLKGREMQFSHYNEDDTKLIFKYTEGGLETLMVFNSDGEFIRGYQSQNEYLYLAVKKRVILKGNAFYRIVLTPKGFDITALAPCSVQYNSYLECYSGGAKVVMYIQCVTTTERKLKAEVAEWRQKYKDWVEHNKLAGEQYAKVCKALLLTVDNKASSAEALADLILKTHEADK